MSDLGDEMCRGIYAHRLLTTGQLHELFSPHTSVRYVRYALDRLVQSGYVACVNRHGSREHVWYLTRRGFAATEGAGVENRRHRVDAAHAAGPLQAHTLAVNEVGLCFVRSARERGDECGPFDWRNETAHPLGPGRGGELIADAVLDYTVVTPTEDVYLCRIVEMDRSSTGVRTLAAKLGAYSRLYDYAPGWMAYPRFPRLLVVLDGPDASALGARRRSLCAHASRLPALRDRPALGALVTTMAELRSRGPLAPIWTPLSEPGRLVDVCGEQGAENRPGLGALRPVSG